MALEASIKTALASIAGGRIYPDTTPDKPVFPCVVYQQVGGEVLNPLEGGDPGKDHARVQFWVFAKTRLEASSVARDVRLALVNSLNAYAYSAPVSTYDDALNLYGARTDFGVWYSP